MTNGLTSWIFTIYYYSYSLKWELSFLLSCKKLACSRVPFMLSPAAPTCPCAHPAFVFIETTD